MGLGGNVRAASVESGDDKGVSFQKMLAVRCIEPKEEVVVANETGGLLPFPRTGRVLHAIIYCTQRTEILRKGGTI